MAGDWIIAPRRRAAALLSVLILASCGTGDHEGLLQDARRSHGIELRTSVWTPDSDAARQALDRAFAEFDRVLSVLDPSRAGGDLQRINAAAGEAPVRVGMEIVEVLLAARQVSDWTSGKFDVTSAVLHTESGRSSEEEFSSRLPLVDYRDVHVDQQAASVRLGRAGMRIALDNIGLGYALDRAAAILRSVGLLNFMIQSGDIVQVSGRRGADAWRITVRDPRGAAGRTFAAVDFENGSAGTSGDYQRYSIKDGIRYHHLLDPDTGRPAATARAVTVLTNHSVLAQALSAGVFVMGPSDGMALIEKLPSVEGLIVTAENSVVVSSGLKGKLNVLAAPSEN